MAVLNLDRVPEMFHEKAKEAFEAGDVLGMLCTMDNTEAPFFVFDNLSVLNEAGLLEMAIIDAWAVVRVSSIHTVSVFPILFAYADRKKLRACGDPLPRLGPFTLFRGCAGKGRTRNVRGYSWSASYIRAQWYAMRFASRLPDPAVYRIEAPEAWILAYLNQSFRGEEEFLVSVPNEAKVKRVWMEGE